MKDTITLVFSKDRPLQLHATLSSFGNHCKDCNIADTMVIYKASDLRIKRFYEELQKEFSKVNFVEEINFKQNLLSAIIGHKYVLFLVDDNIFVRNFSLSKCINAIEDTECALAFSLRLSTTTKICYPTNTQQEIPTGIFLDYNTFLFNWIDADGDFGYPLEVSSSLYRINDILCILQQCPYHNPNELESFLAINKNIFIHKKKFLFCYKNSVTFCNPVNKIQTLYNNRSANEEKYSINNLLMLFENGFRINIEKFNNYTPISCHEEVDFL